MNAQKREGRITSRAGALTLLALLLAGSCKMGIPNYTLTVVLADGVTGTPPAGQYTYKEMSVVRFNYSATNVLETVEVMLNDNIRYNGLGSFLMYGDGYKLTANVIDIRGSYKILLTYADTSVTAPEPFIITLMGSDRLSGVFTDERGYHGTWTAQSDILTLAYWDWEFYVLTGKVYDMGHGSGTFTGGGLAGIWTAVKQ